MHVHLPKPLHGWREFAGEVGIIVIGVLIALGAEQLVESWHWHAQAEDARAAIRSELADDDLPQAYARLAVAFCLDRQMKDLQSAIDQHADRSRVVALAQHYTPPSRTWDSEAWEAVVATGDLSHGGSGELIRWSSPYRLVSVLGPRNEKEVEDRNNLLSLSSEQGQLTPAELDRVTVALVHLRHDEVRMVSGSKALLAAAREAGVSMSSAAKRSVLNELRPSWGACLREPGSVSYNPTSQDARQDAR